MKTKFNLKLEKDKSRTLVYVAIATALSVFCLVSVKTLWSQASYHRQVLGAKRDAIKQLKSNIDNVATLKTQYDTFNSANPNFLGGKNVSDQNALPPDGNNTRLVLNALPTTYDFPALISSASKVVSTDHLANPSIAGSDTSASTASSPSANPQPVPIPLSISGLTSYGNVRNFIHDLERSTRPFDITKLQFSGSSNSMSLSSTMTTYFQPAKILNTGTKVIR